MPELCVLADGMLLQNENSYKYFEFFQYREYTSPLVTPEKGSVDQKLVENIQVFEAKTSKTQFC